MQLNSAEGGDEKELRESTAILQEAMGYCHKSLDKHNRTTQQQTPPTKLDAETRDLLKIYSQELLQEFRQLLKSDSATGGSARSTKAESTQV